jgi:hypothetical protein
MPVTLAYSLSAAGALALALAGVLVVLGGVLGMRAWKRSRVSPEERERLRRATLVARGKMGDANLVEVRDNHLFFSYDVRGVQYTASQDVSKLTNFMPPDLSVAIGPVAVKYDPRNPANSVVLSEEWSGLRASGTQIECRTDSKEQDSR